MKEVLKDLSLKELSQKIIFSLKHDLQISARDRYNVYKSKGGRRTLGYFYSKAIKELRDGK